jgi:DNA polymerase III epsilon subunit-like protein
MAERYIVFDVETPNSRDDRMSAIGVTVVEGGEIVQEIGSLIDPEAWFDPFNIALTGITPGMARRAPHHLKICGLYWSRSSPMEACIAHNAPFDMGVLAKCLRAYGICGRQTADYACTVRMGRRCYPYLENHRLSTLCAHLDIELAHHRAESDSRACAELLLDYLGHGLDIKRFPAYI